MAFHIPENAFSDKFGTLHILLSDIEYLFCQSYRFFLSPVLIPVLFPVIFYQSFFRTAQNRSLLYCHPDRA